MKNLTKIHLVTMDTNTAKEECTCSMHYALLLYFQTKKKQYDQNQPDFFSTFQQVLYDQFIKQRETYIQASKQEKASICGHKSIFFFTRGTDT